MLFRSRTPLAAIRGYAELTRRMDGDVPPDVKASVESLTKEVAALSPRLTQPQGRGGRGPTESLVTKVGQAKNGLTAGMSPGDQTVRAYTEVKAQTPKAISDLNALIAKATTLSSALAPYNLTLTVPTPVKAPEVRPSSR